MAALRPAGIQRVHGATESALARSDSRAGLVAAVIPTRAESNRASWTSDEYGGPGLGRLVACR